MHAGSSSLCRAPDAAWGLHFESSMHPSEICMASATSTLHCVTQVSCKSQVTDSEDLHVAAFLAAAIQSCENT